MFNSICLFITLFLCFLIVNNVNSKHLQGPVLTKYEPCGLGVIYFDRMPNTSVWKGFIRYGLYSNLDELNLKIIFGVPVTINATLPIPNLNILSISVVSKTCQGKCEHLRSTTLNLVIRPHKRFEKYVFQVEVHGTNKKDVLFVSKVELNEKTICSDEMKLQQHDNVCGRRSMNHTEMNSFRTEAKSGDWPWHVAMFIRDTEFPQYGSYVCGGSIISKTAVLTAGHCISVRGEILDRDTVVFIGGVSNYGDDNQIGKVVRFAKELILHPNYNDNLSTFDVGIVKVNAFNYTAFVQPICIWAPSNDKTNLFGKEATIVGFGYTEKNEKSKVLKVANTLIQGDRACLSFKTNKEDDNSMYARYINDYTLCGGYGPDMNIQPRKGDSGGGLIFKALQQDNMISWMLRGVMSRCGSDRVKNTHIITNLGEETVTEIEAAMISKREGNRDFRFCNPSYYYVYSDIAPHYEWIKNNSMLDFHIQSCG